MSTENRTKIIRDNAPEWIKQLDQITDSFNQKDNPNDGLLCVALSPKEGDNRYMGLSFVSGRISLLPDLIRLLFSENPDLIPIAQNYIQSLSNKSDK